MKKILTVFGTRPEAIKMCPLVKELVHRSDRFETIVCVSGQHDEMLKQVLDVFEVVPAYDFAIMKEGQTLFDITQGVMRGIEDVLDRENPDVVLVHGDTTTSFAASLACFYKHVRIGYVEAGLRTYNLEAPWPEEFNRQVVDLVSAFRFAPTETAKRNLLREGADEGSIYVTGNTGIDAMRTTVSSAYDSEELNWAKGCRLVLLTAHRRENLGEPMYNMFRAIRRVVEEHEDVRAIYPVHMNPAVRKAARDVLGDNDHIKLIEPLNVIDFHNFMNASYLILTDSGGIQEEAPSLGKPVLVMRDTTERPEGVEAGTLRLVGTSEDVIYDAFTELLDDPAAYAAMSNASNPYGDGHASERIADALLARLSPSSN